MGKRIIYAAASFFLFLFIWIPAASANVSEYASNTGSLSDDGFILSAAPEDDPENTLIDVCLSPQVKIETETEQKKTSAPYLVYDILVSHDRTELFLLSSGNNPSSLLLPETAFAVYDHYEAEECRIVWRFEEFDNLTPGRRTLTGDVTLPNDFQFLNEKILAEVSILVYEPDGAVNERIADCTWNRNELSLIPLGTSRQELDSFFRQAYNTVIIQLESGFFFEASYALNLNAVDTTKAGTYYPLILELPGKLEPDERTALFSLAVHVVPTQEVDLRAVTFQWYEYSIQWLHGARDPVLWISVDNEEWFTPEDEQHSFVSYYVEFHSNKYSEPYYDGVSISYAALPEGHIYAFVVQYDDGRYSNVLEIDLVNYSSPKCSGYEGDRNGGDRAGGELPDKDLSPPVTGGTKTEEGYSNTGSAADTNRQKLQPETAETLTDIPQENTDWYSITVSGQRLDAMIAANPASVSFLRGELRVSIPAEALSALRLDAGDTFTVTLYMQNTESFVVAFAVNGNPQMHFDTLFVVSIPWEGSAVFCKREDLPAIEGLLDIPGSRVSFTLDHSGTYMLMEETGAIPYIAANDDDFPMEPDFSTPSDFRQDTGDAYSDSAQPVLIAATFGLCGAGGYAGFIRRKRRRRS